MIKKTKLKKNKNVQMVAQGLMHSAELPKPYRAGDGDIKPGSLTRSFTFEI